MSLLNLKVGDKVVGFPYGIGEFVGMDNSCPCVFVIKFPRKDVLCDIRKSYSENGGECGYSSVPSCWPIFEAPDWVWGALGIEKPKRMVIKEITKYCVLSKYTEDIVFNSERVMEAERWMEAQITNKYVIGKAVITFATEE